MIEAATELFADRGLDAPLDEIASRAGVGNATLYRHFPTRWALIAAVFVGQMEQYTEVIETAAAQPDPGPALRSCVTGIGELQAGSRGLAELLTTTDLNDEHLDALRSRSYRALVALIRRATRSGAVRPDLRPQDVALLMVANAGLIARTAADAPGASARLVAVWLDGIAAPAATAGPPPPPSACSSPRCAAPRPRPPGPPGDQAARLKPGPVQCCIRERVQKMLPGPMGSSSRAVTMAVRKEGSDASPGGISSMDGTVVVVQPCGAAPPPRRWVIQARAAGAPMIARLACSLRSSR
jgi:AcrR family transcriptional regulator